MSDLEQFRTDTRKWLAANCPPGARGPGQVANGSSKIKIRDPDVTLWLDRMAEKGWTVPTWPREYGGGGLSTAEYVVLLEEMRAIGARPPLVNRGTSMVGPTLLEVGSEDQKKRHLPAIARGEGEWCQGYSEPGAGSDLASLRTSAVLDGDHFVINGQKTWTSDADTSDWMFMLVRSDPDVPKHEGISFLLLTMDQPGISTTPIEMISGGSPFSETFFDNAFADKDDLIGGLNQGWSVGKRLLQHERSGMESLISGSAGTRPVGLVDTARGFLGEVDGRIADDLARDDVLQYEMHMRALQLTQRRSVEESSDGRTPGPATSIFKTVGTDLEKRYAELMTSLRGTQGYGWEGDSFSDEELAATRRFLQSRAASIYSGSNEIQRNIIAKRVLGLPD
ncbi:MAG: acyl-CoA dehydrogenase family protein [Pseudomonadales bacterium]|jgi:acyl-CoA dehydrogenase|nr:acyl-CoA dehydrogenase family protein [Pseudomonadales bacterium]MDP7359208.1 acyl-CoA dehydrogenase family protein [Pseudomonadales bacterium]MDP7595165.1 acyl-CoA dehydrogenase family protein [Pseudomonadales bacterium]HJN50192.1 acyl-CoA dehydrogenase family protein [Pseudomonadales bacterium]|tara:strand:+ start:672 stop:1853 length:1182 start_codon:yes stop_codon:yes gene_type:complete